MEAAIKQAPIADITKNKPDTPEAGGVCGVPSGQLSASFSLAKQEEEKKGNSRKRNERMRYVEEHDEDGDAGCT